MKSYRLDTRDQSWNQTQPHQVRRHSVVTNKRCFRPREARGRFHSQFKEVYWNQIKGKSSNLIFIGRREMWNRP
jgi:hypothetical protein